MLSHRLDASRHFLANFLVISGRILNLNFTNYFGGKGFALDPNKGLQTLTKSFPFPFSLGTLHLNMYCSCKRCITNAFSEEESRHFLIYHYITGCLIHSYFLTNTADGLMGLLDSSFMFFCYYELCFYLVCKAEWICCSKWSIILDSPP